MRWFFPSLVSLAALCLAAGCGTGGGTAPLAATPAPTPTPAFNRQFTVSARAYSTNSSPIQGEAASAGVRVSWAGDELELLPALQEFHVYRERTLVGVVGADSRFFSDLARPRDPFVARRATATGDVISESVAYVPFTPGVSYRYEIRALFREGNPARYEERLVGPARFAVTPVLRPAALGPTDPQNLSRVRVAFNTVAGADEYVFEFSDRDTFNPKVQKGPFTFPPVVGSAESPTLDLSADFPNLPANRIIYCRVGARNSGDVLKPEARGKPNPGDYVYSRLNLTFPKAAE